MVMFSKKKDEIVWLDSPNQSFSVKVAWEQLRIHHQMVDWHDIVWFSIVTYFSSGNKEINNWVPSLTQLFFLFFFFGKH